MNLNSSALFDQIEIITSCLNGINIIRGLENQLAKSPQYASDNEIEGSPSIDSDITAKSLRSIWTYINQALSPLIIWMILGFATGFLIGMIKPR
jgi:hypothetical protein